MPKKTKRHIKREPVSKKIPRISVMEQQKKRRSKLYLWLSVGATALIVIAITIGALVANRPKAPESELIGNHFKQKTGYFEMDTPKDWIMQNTLAATAPYGLENCQYPYLFKPANETADKPASGDSATVTADLAPNNILCAVFTKDAKADDIEKFLLGQNIIAETNLVEFFSSKGKVMGTKIENVKGWIFGDKPMKELVAGSVVAYIEGNDFTAYLHGKFDSDANRDEIIKSFKSIKTNEVEPANLTEFKDMFGYVTVPTPEGWKCDVSSDVLQIHQIVKDYGAIFYPAGENKRMQFSPEQLKTMMEGKEGKKIEGEVSMSTSFSMPLSNYLAVYIIDPKTNPAAFDNALEQFVVGFGMNGIKNPYDWIKENAKKGTSMEKSQGKYFINDPIQIMQVKPVNSIFGLIESKDGNVVLMGGWTNDGIKKIIIDTINKITAAPKSK